MPSITTKLGNEALLYGRTAHLVITAVCRGVLVVGTELEALHDALDARVGLPGQVTGAQVPGDELVTDGDDVPQVGRQTEPEHGELVTLQRVLPERDRGLE